MGNSISASDDNKDRLVTSKITRLKLQEYLKREARENVPNIELINVSQFLFGKINKLNETIKFNEILEKLELEDKLNKDLQKFLYILLKQIANWPNLASPIYLNAEKDDEFFSLSEVITLIYLIYHDGFQKLGLHHNYLSKMIFVLLSSELPQTYPILKNNSVLEIENQEVDIITCNEKIKWNLMPVVQSFDEIEESRNIQSNLRKLLMILLPLSVYSLNRKSFELNYNQQIESIMNTIFISNNFEGNSVNHEIFSSNIENFTPKVLDILKKLFHPMVYKGLNGNNVCQDKDDLKINYKILNLQLLAQLTTCLDISELNLDINSKPLYQGSKEGYSINSIQSHTLNYKATSILLISGKTIESEKAISRTFFKKYPKFHPMLKSEMKIKEKSKFQVAVIIPTQWRVSNFKNFGTKEFKIIQLSPFQIIYDASKSIRTEFAYFSNLGCGLGFGLKPPIKSKDIKDNSVKFDNIGGVSLVIDNSLEVGNFRVEDMSIQSSVYCTSNKNIQNQNLFNDIWFKINEIEIYGLGNLQSLEDQKKALEWEEREAERRRGINTNDYKESRALLELAGIIGGHQSGGSV